MDKKSARIRRARRSRSRIQQLEINRLCIHRSLQHMYAQIISPEHKVLVTASTVESGIKNGLKSTGNIEAAAQVGKEIATRATEKGITNVAFDRSGYKYHGRVQALAEAAREAGLQF